MENPKYQVFKSTTNNQFYFRLRAKNGEIILSSEGYFSKSDCLNGIRTVKANATYDHNYRRYGQYVNFYFTLHAANNQVIGKSEMYTTAAARDNGITAVKRDASTASIEDFTLQAV